MDQDKISVIVPVYNAAPYLKTCICAILAQTYTNLEVLLINDGSSDCSGEMCDAFAQQDPRVKVIHQQNQGVSAARNRGIDAASGAWLAFVDSDDIISRRMIGVLHDLAICHDADIAMCGWQRLAEQTGLSVSERPVETGVFSRKDALRNIITTFGYGGFLWNKLFRADLFLNPERLRLCRDISLCEDLLITCQLTDRSSVIAYTSEKLYGYVIRRDSATNTITEKTLSSLTARKRIIAIYDRYNLPDARSRYAYALSNLLTFRNTAVVQTHFGELLAEFLANRPHFVPELHSKTERVMFCTLATCPRLFSWIYSNLRSIRSIVWKKRH